MNFRDHASIVVVGAGPAGMAAAVRAAEHGSRVTIIDDNPSAGGQIWRGQQVAVDDRDAAPWFNRLCTSANLRVLTGARVLAGNAEQHSLLVDTAEGARTLHYKKLILATGARELFLPFPGWTLPGVMGVGGFQAMVKQGLPVRGKRVVVAGTGPLLLAVAAYLRKKGATVLLIAEQAPWSRLLGFGLRLAWHPSKLWQALRLQSSLIGTPYRPGTWIESAEGDTQVRRVYVRNVRRRWSLDCDYLAIAYGFVPNNELAIALQCHVKNSFVKADQLQQTSQPDIFCAGEATGIGGVDLSLIEGQIAGHAASGTLEPIHSLHAKRRAAQRFAADLNHAFQLRRELFTLADPQTIVCRCEDVTLGQLQTTQSWRAAKLHTRCGMGPCQGRICGPAVQQLLGWAPSSIRMPIFPTRVDSLISDAIHSEETLTV